MDHRKIEYLVVDTSALIKNAPIQELCDNAITCQDVVNEVTSKKQIRRLVVLPYDLKVKEVFPENIKFVSDFSKKTGDYPSLSATDIKVIALTYQLEKEVVGNSSHLNKTPESQRVLSIQNRPVVDLKDTVGFYIPSKLKRSESEERLVVPSDIKEDVPTLSDRLSAVHCHENEHSEEHSNENSFPNDLEESCLNESVQEHIAITQSSLDQAEEANVVVDDDKVEDDDEVDDDDEVEDDDDEEGWITPDNIKDMKRKINAEFEEEKHVQVACLTTDFAMQNVLKQIGLHVSSIDGKIIKQMRTFILRCYACFKTTSVMTKVFCPSCGHKTLKRVAVTVEPDGSQKIHINARKRITTKGKNVSLPLFQGGKHSNNPVIFADQPMPDQRPSRIARTKTNILDGDYIAGFSPFALRDTTSKSAMLGIRAKEMKHWMRNGTNAGHRRK